MSGVSSEASLPRSTDEHIMKGSSPYSATILIISGGVGASAEQVVHTVLAQFPDSAVRVIAIPNVRFADQIENALKRAEECDAIVVHTLVDAALRLQVRSQARQRGVVALDLMGELLEELSARLAQKPLEQPGLYRQLNKEYFDRVEAIEYSMTHDDGLHPEDWGQAEILILGVSRVGKTPLSMYLSVLGWKTANYPIIPDIAPPEILFKLDHRRVIGLRIELTQLLAFRKQRQRRLGVSGASDYANPEKIYAELEYADKIYQRGNFTTLQVSDKPIETSADEVIRLVTHKVV